MNCRLARAAISGAYIYGSYDEREIAERRRIPEGIFCGKRTRAPTRVSLIASFRRDLFARNGRADVATSATTRLPIISAREGPRCRVVLPLEIPVTARIIAENSQCQRRTEARATSVCLTRSRVIKPWLRTTSEPAGKALRHIRLTRDLFLPVHLIRR